jgi:DNA-binding response OmpR family regulator
MSDTQAPASILLVDDSKGPREMYAEILAAAGHSVTLATNGEEAIALASTARFDVVVIDLVLLKIEGVAVIRTLRTNRRTKTIPIVALSGPMPEKMLKAIVEMGADLMLDKPCSPNELRTAVRVLLKRGGRRS